MARSLNFRQIEAFQAVMQRGTATGAAAMLNTTQPSISRRIAELQDATGLRLFDHHHGRLRPTREADTLYRSIQQHFSGLRSIESVAAIMRTSGTGVLRLGCTPTLGLGFVPALVRRFRLAFPGTYVNIQTLGTPQLAQYLRQDLFDLVLTTGTLDPGDFRPVVVRRDQAVCVLPPGHRLARVRRLRLSMLAGEPLLSLSDTEASTLAIKALLRRECGIGEFAIETTSSITICALVAAGNGVAIVNPYVADTFASQLVVKRFAPSIEIMVQMAMPTHSAPSLLTRGFIALLDTIG